MRYVDGKTAEGPFVKQIDNELIHVKRHDETRREYMTLAMEMERMKRQVAAETAAITATTTATNIAKAMLHDGLSIEFISSYTHLPTEELKKLREEIH